MTCLDPVSRRLTRVACTVLALALALLAPRQSVADDVPFLRGDANEDGVVSLADAHFILSSLFRDGATPGCQKAADVTDDGVIQLTDAIRILGHLFLGGSPTPCSPYPEPGLDPTLDNLICESYGGGASLPDASAQLTLTDATANAEGKATISVLISSSRSVGGFSGVFSVEGGALAAGQQVEHEAFNGSDEGGYRSARVLGGLLTFASLNSFTLRESTAPGSGIRVMDMTICLAKGTPAGQYRIQPQAAEIVDYETGRAIHPSVGESLLTVLTDLGPNAGCEALADPESPATCHPAQGPPPEPDPGNGVQFVRGDANADGRISVSDAVMIRRYLFNGKRPPACLDSADLDDNGQVQLTDVIRILGYLFLGGVPPEPLGAALAGDPTADYLTCREYTVTPAAESDDLIRIGNIDAVPGEEVAVPVYVTNSVAVEAFQLVVQYDPLLFTPKILGGLIFDGTFYENNTSGLFHTVVSDPEHGVFSIGFIPSLTETTHDTPPGEDRLVFKIPGTISASATPGTSVALAPTNGPEGAGYGPAKLRNELTHAGEARYASTLPLLEAGLIGIVGDQTFFIRGDSNGDDKLDVSDPVRTLGTLFLGAGQLDCEDAADANDDGQLDLSDVVATLERLFLGAASLPLPDAASPGPDPTPDSLRCRRER